MTLRTDSGANATQPSRGYYEVLVHDRPSIPADLVDEDPSVPAAVAAARPTAQAQQTQIDSYRTKQLDRFQALSAKVDGSPTGRMNIAKYENELRWYAEALNQSWSPAQSAADKRAALDRIFLTIDRYTKMYYGDVRSLGSGGHQSDWGGFYAELGEALYIVENLIADEAVLGEDAFAALLAEPFATGTSEGPNSIAGVDWDGGPLTRGAAWERVLKANFDFARTRLSYISNQVHYTYEGAWRAHEGLRVIGSEFYEGKERSHRILREIWGVEPFLGEEVLVGPDGQELDLYHSLFNHDGNAEFTEDFLRYVMRGLAKSKLDGDGEIVRRTPYGEHYLSITGDQALLRENRYVGNYGETGSWIPAYFWRTWGHVGDEDLNADLLKQALRNMNARAHTRYQGITADGKRVMYMEQVVDDRNPAYPGKIAYTTDTGQNLALLYASLEQHMADNAELYAGDEWDEYWGYARDAVGYFQQQVVDGQYFNNFNATLGTQSFNKDLKVPETWAWVTGGRAANPLFGSNVAGVVLPGTDLDLYTNAELQELGVARDALDAPKAWVDIDNLMVTIRDGDAALTGSLAMQNYGWSSNGRLHVRQPGWSHNAQVRTQGVFDYEKVDVRPSTTDHPMFVDAAAWGIEPPLAQGGELIPITHQPGVGTVLRDNYMADTPYSAYPDVIWTSYGEWFIAINTTRAAYGNAATHSLKLPAGAPAQVDDLVSGGQLATGGAAGSRTISLAPGQSVVLRIADADARAGVPERVDVAVASAGAGSVALAWGRAAGAASYTILRDGVAVAQDVTGASWLDTGVPAGSHQYAVVAVGGGGSAAPSTAVAATTTGGGIGDGWQQNAIGSAGSAVANVDGSGVTLSVSSAGGLADGDDFNQFQRLRPDSVGLVSQLTNGSVEVTARLAETEGGFSGIILRDSLDPVARYAALGADADGELQLRIRELDTRANLTGKAGVDGAIGDVASPRVIDLDYTVEETPFVRIEREARTQRVTILVSADGASWTRVTTAPFVAADTLHVGLVSDGSVEADEVAVEPLAVDQLRVHLEKRDEQLDLRWNRPEESTEFAVYRATGAQLPAFDPDSEDWTLVVASTLDSGVSQRVLGETVHYRIAALDVTGAEIASATVSTDGYSLVDYVERARDIDEASYTRASVRDFNQRLDEIAVQAAAPDAGADAIVAAVDAARGLLVPAHSSSFEMHERNLWVFGGSAPAAFTRDFDETPGTARTGTGSLLFTSTDTSGSGGYNLWARTPISGSPRVSVKAGEPYRVSFWYQLTDYVPGPTVGAYLFVRPAGNGAYTASETRYWLPTSAATAPGEWRQFERVFTPGANVDTLEIMLGFRGSHGVFRVDDLSVRPVNEPEVPEPTPPTVAATTRCVAGKVVLAVTVGNASDAPVPMTITSGYGSKAFEEILPGRSVSAAFSTRVASIAAGSVTVAQGGDSPVEAEAAYEARSCA
ncbi:MAG TPA: hypothetical protein PKE40_10655 [Arachnia sp.]|nr:hypothetical protein [Arachnia sp.]HMT86804.1 hypothetical protein [Arachnia sp.]